MPLGGVSAERIEQMLDIIHDFRRAPKVFGLIESLGHLA
jgi:hypothetical protein